MKITLTKISFFLPWQKEARRINLIWSWSQDLFLYFRLPALYSFPVTFSAEFLRLLFSISASIYLVALILPHHTIKTTGTRGRILLFSRLMLWKSPNPPCIFWLPREQLFQAQVRDKKADTTVYTYWNHWGGCGSDSYKILSCVLFSVLCKGQSQKASHGPIGKKKQRNGWTSRNGEQTLYSQAPSSIHYRSRVCSLFLICLWGKNK